MGKYNDQGKSIQYNKVGNKIYKTYKMKLLKVVVKVACLLTEVVQTI